MKNICKCGHELNQHNKNTSTGHYTYCSEVYNKKNKCKCKKFKPVPSQQDKKEDFVLKQKDKPQKGCRKVYNCSKDGRDFVICGSNTPSHGLKLCPKCEPEKGCGEYYWDKKFKLGKSRCGIIQLKKLSLCPKCKQNHSHKGVHTCDGRCLKNHSSSMLSNVKDTPEEIPKTDKVTSGTNSQQVGKPEVSPDLNSGASGTFNLSEKINQLYKDSDDGRISTGKVEDCIKEFVKKLNDYIEYFEGRVGLDEYAVGCLEEIRQKINKLAGENLK